MEKMGKVRKLLRTNEAQNKIQTYLNAQDWVKNEYKIRTTRLKSNVHKLCGFCEYYRTGFFFAQSFSREHLF